MPFLPSFGHEMVTYRRHHFLRGDLLLLSVQSLLETSEANRAVEYL
jgi:hypothetical protein